MGGLEMSFGFHELIAASVVAGTIWGAGNVIGHATSVEPMGMRLVYLGFENGKFVQEHAIYGAPGLGAHWVSQISRNGEPLCEGGGEAPYASGDRKIMSPNYWTDDNCPEILPGDVGFATWEWVDEHGVHHVISGRIEIPD